MTIVSSVISQTSVEIDGRTWVYETHTDHLGVTYTSSWLCPVGDPIDGQLVTHAAAIWSNLVAAEINTNVDAVSTLGKYAVPTFNYSTYLDNALALQVAYATATQQQCIFMGEFLNTLSDDQLQVVGLTTDQISTLRTANFEPAAIIATSIRTAVGV